MKPWRRTAIALFIGLTAASTAAQQATSVAPPAAARAQKGSDGVQDGIQLHGNWVLDIRNPDGTLVAHSEFKNALQVSGQTALADLLAGQPLYDWYVTFNGTGSLDGNSGPATGPLCNSGDGGVCYVLTPGGPLAGNLPSNISTRDTIFPTLSKASSGGKFILTGTFTVTVVGGGHVDSVFTHLVTGASSTLVARVLTKATLPTPVVVAQGQIVQFTYTLSFS
jgi:hypothetical protein